MGSLKNGSYYCIKMKENSKEGVGSRCLIYENIPVGIAVLDCKGICCKVNSRLCKILGCSEPELLGNGFKELMYFKGPWIDSWIPEKNPLETSMQLNEQGHCFKKDGNEVWISISPFIIMDAENMPNFVVLQINDITAQKKTDINFGIPEISFDSVYQNISEGIVINEQVGKFLEANPAICKMLGYSREELLQKTATEFIAPKSSKIFAEQVRELYRNGKATVKITAVRKDGILFPVELNM